MKEPDIKPAVHWICDETGVDGKRREDTGSERKHVQPTITLTSKTITMDVAAAPLTLCNVTKVI